MSTTTRARTIQNTPTGQPRPRRRRGVVAGGLMLAALGGLVVAWMVSAAGGRSDVLVLARDVPYGQVITFDDLAVTAVAVDPLVATVPAGERSTIVGRVAATNLVAGALLAESQLTADAPPGPGEVLVPMPVRSDRLPAGGLRAGDRVLVVDAPSVGADPSQVSPATFDATVVRVGQPDLNEVVVVDVAAAEADGPSLATRAATGRFAFAVVNPGGGS